MDQSQKDNAAKLAEMIIDKGEPHKDSSSAVLKLAGRSVGTSSERFRELLAEMTTKVTKSKEQVVIDNHRNCLNYILNTLVLCVFRFEWLSLPTNPANFISGKYLHRLGFTRRIMERCIDVLEKEGLMALGRKGYRGGKETKPKASQYFPSSDLIREMCESLYMEFGDFDANEDNDLYSFNRFNDEDIPPYVSYQYKIDILRRYNGFMRDHSWAMKNPSHLSVKDFDGRSGRVTNYYQNIAQRRVSIRTSTLLDGYPIAEPDFSANHLRMASFLVGEELPEDPYTTIGDETGLTRGQIKSIVTKCMGASNLGQKGGIIKDSRIARIAINKDEFRAALDSLERNYPWLNDILFHDFGTRLQYLEGEIALGMMEWSVNEEAPLLVVHDAYAVRSIDEERACEQMHSVWLQVLHKAKREDFIARTAYTVPLVIERNMT